MTALKFSLPPLSARQIRPTVSPMYFLTWIQEEDEVRFPVEDNELRRNSRAKSTNHIWWTDGLRLYFVCYTERYIAASASIDPIHFWLHYGDKYPALSQLALDIISAPASEAYADWVFSHCELLTAGRNNRTAKNLHRRAFLRLNTGLWPIVNVIMPICLFVEW